MDKDKKNFWKALTSPAERGCWNCKNRLSDGEACGALSICVVLDINDKHTPWEWDGEVNDDESE